MCTCPQERATRCLAVTLPRRAPAVPATLSDAVRAKQRTWQPCATLTHSHAHNVTHSAPAGPALTLLTDDGAHCIP